MQSDPEDIRALVEARAEIERLKRRWGLCAEQVVELESRLAVVRGLADEVAVASADCHSVCGSRFAQIACASGRTIFSGP